jgi:cyclopropane fatty-acyl-phospholipid synthase-like methyltransferase
VNAGDVVYDLGCGDGRIVITAVRDFGARGVCVDTDPARIAESRKNARQANVVDRIRFLMNLRASLETPRTQALGRPVRPAARDARGSGK